MNKCIIFILLICCFVCLCSCSDKLDNINEKWTLSERNVDVLSDGTAVELWNNSIFNQSVYKLSDGTSLLCVTTSDDLSGISNDILNETTKKQVREFYKSNDLMYDLHDELEKSYMKFQNCMNNKTEFKSITISKELVFNIYNDDIVGLMTVLVMPVESDKVQEFRIGRLFDRNTGEVLDNWSLFNCTEQEACKKILEASNIFEQDMLMKMEEAMKSEFIILLPDHLEVFFPYGEIQGEEFSYAINVELDKLSNILQPWVSNFKQ